VKKAFQFVKKISVEILLILFCIIASNQLLNKKNQVIDADGRGYYEFLPATFIYKDLHFNYLDTLKTEFYDSDFISTQFYPRLANGQRYDKYFIGTAILQAPFFAVAHGVTLLTKNGVSDGFSRPYQLGIFCAALFYLFGGLLFIRGLLKSFEVNSFWVFMAQFGVVFCTSILNYVFWDAAYSHIYSFFLIAGFLYFVRSYFQCNSSSSLAFAILFLGLIFLVRPINILVIVFIPILSQDFSHFLTAMKGVFTTKIRTTSWSILAVICLFQIQCLVWYFQTGNWIQYAYGDESFNWSNPHFIDFLFSYRKGFFLWAPWFFVCMCLAVVLLIIQRKWKQGMYFLGSFSLLIYVLSSWWYWSCPYTHLRAHETG
jgi:hypothetical protein